MYIFNSTFIVFGRFINKKIFTETKSFALFTYLDHYTFYIVFSSPIILGFLRLFFYLLLVLLFVHCTELKC